MKGESDVIQTVPGNETFNQDPENAIYMENLLSQSEGPYGSPDPEVCTYFSCGVNPQGTPCEDLVHKGKVEFRTSKKQKHTPKPARRRKILIRNASHYQVNTMILLPIQHT